MPIFDYVCAACGNTAEILMTGSQDIPKCSVCGGDLNKLMSAPSSLSGISRNRLPGPKDTGCCGSRPGEGSCAGPGSCCGRAL